MKKLLLAVAFALLSLGQLSAVTVRPLYEKYADRQDVSSVFVSPALFRLLGRLPEVQLSGREDGVALAPLLRSMSGLYLLQALDGPASETLCADVEAFVRSGKYELLLESKDGAESSRIYVVTRGADTVTSLVVLTRSGGQTLFLGLDGEMPKDELAKIMAERPAR